jgi:acyl-CoA thioester hydrolase
VSELSDGAPAPFSHVERVRFGDLDAMQHMNNVEFLRFFETARIEYLKLLLPEHSPTGRREFRFIFG